MKLKLDENLGRRTVELLVQAGYGVATVASEGLFAPQLKRILARTSRWQRHGVQCRRHPRVHFDDATVQTIDFEPVLAGELYGPLRDVTLFNRVSIDPKVHTLVWPDAAAFDPATLHDWPQHEQELRERARHWQAIEVWGAESALYAECERFREQSGGHLMKLTAIIEAEGDGYVSLCPELDIASQGDSIEQARDNLREALELFFECASPEELKQRLHGDVYVTQVEVATG
jgi:predicted RNase H-like HicB family nuclease